MLIRNLRPLAASILAFGMTIPAVAAQLSTDARGAIPNAVQQIVTIDYRAMQNSPTAMQLRNKLMPPELKQLEESLKNSGLNENKDIEILAFVSFRISATSEQTRTVGVAQGQYSLEDVYANLRKQKIRATLYRTNRVYPMGGGGSMISFLDKTTMVFGSLDAVKSALDARDGMSRNLLTNNSMMDAMKGVENEPLWSILDQKGTQTMVHTLLGEASAVADFDAVKKRLISSSYSMNFQNGVKFSLNIQTPDGFTSTTLSSLLNAASLYKKATGSAIEKQAMDATKIDSNGGLLTVYFAASDSQFNSLLGSPLFQSVVH
jgi:hypothetical protein